MKILKADETVGQVLQYEAQPLNMRPPDQALVFVHAKDEAATRPFELNKLVAQNIGIEEIEKKSFREHIESEVLIRIKEIEEKAYKEAYDLGLEDGRKKAYEDHTSDIQNHLASLAQVLEQVSTAKNDLFVKNEMSIVKAMFVCARSLAFKEINMDNTSVREVLKTAIENAQTDERVVVRINPDDLAFVEALKGDANPQYDKLRNIKLEADPAITRGGCIIETNYGVIDATIEERVGKLWKILESKMPKIQE